MSERYFVPDWPLPPGLRAACTLRGGGVSTGPWRSFNLATHVGDDADSVAGNRALLREDLQLPTEPAWLEQVHGSNVVSVSAVAMAPAWRADAAIDRAGRVLAVQIADCLPVLLAAQDGSCYGAAHAGWRGLAAGVLENTVRALAVPPQCLSVWLGPCIRSAAFEVGAEVRAAFGVDFHWAFTANSRGRWQCDLAGIATARLRSLGIAQIVDCGLCTASDPERFFSHRRDAAQLGSSGRMAALLWRTVS
jgi:YfiH family protein